MGQGVSYAVFWRCVEEFGEEPFKINLTIYQKDILQAGLAIIKQQRIVKRICTSVQVKGLSFLLWMLDCYPSLDRLVNLLKTHQEVGWAWI